MLQAGSAGHAYGAAAVPSSGGHMQAVPQYGAMYGAPAPVAGYGPSPGMVQPGFYQRAPAAQAAPASYGGQLPGAAYGARVPGSHMVGNDGGYAPYAPATGGAGVMPAAQSPHAFHGSPVAARYGYGADGGQGGALVRGPGAYGRRGPSVSAGSRPGGDGSYSGRRGGSRGNSIVSAGDMVMRGVTPLSSSLAAQLDKQRRQRRSKVSPERDRFGHKPKLVIDKVRGAGGFSVLIGGSLRDGAVCGAFTGLVCCRRK